MSYDNTHTPDNVYREEKAPGMGWLLPLLLLVLTAGLVLYFMKGCADTTIPGGVAAVLC